MATDTRGAAVYERVLVEIFRSRFKPKDRTVEFERNDIRRTAEKLGLKVPDNLGDVLYSFRYRRRLPEEIQKHAPKGHEWVLTTSKKSTYAFVAREVSNLAPSALLAEILVPDSTPGLIALYALTDEQALLAKLRYNRLVDVFTGVTCYSLQNHLRTTVGGGVQVETDEIYIGIDARGAHYVFPVQAKGGRDRLGIVQIEQDFAMCEKKFPSLICRPVAAQFMDDDLIALFSFTKAEGRVRVLAEKHYRLIPRADSADHDFAVYNDT
jgi:hypothetical protein